jgi:hypothetical protein
LALIVIRHSPHRPNREQISLDVFPDRSDQCDDRSPVRRNVMNTATESERNPSAPEVPLPKTKRATAKKAKPAKQAGRAGKPASKPKTDRANKKAEVIAMMKRAKGAPIAEGVILSASKKGKQSKSASETFTRFGMAIRDAHAGLHLQGRKLESRL